MNACTRLGLGTVQFGLDYGVSNLGGRTPEAEVGCILNLAADLGIRILDTAAGYGNSEEVLGKTLPIKHPFAIITKTPVQRADESGDTYIARVRESFRQSLLKLGQKKLYGILVHRAEDLLSAQGERLMEVLLEVKQLGLVEKVGVSVYSAAQIDAIMFRYRVEIVQLPVSVLDQRLISSGHVASLKNAGIEIHARSAFLQGLLLMPPETLPTYFSRVRSHLMGYRVFLEKAGLTPLQGALGFVLGLPELDHVILGVNTVAHLQELLAAQLPQVDTRIMDQFALTDPAILDPSRWHLNQA